MFAFVLNDTSCKTRNFFFVFLPVFVIILNTNPYRTSYFLMNTRQTQTTFFHRNSFFALLQKYRIDHCTLESFAFRIIILQDVGIKNQDLQRQTHLWSSQAYTISMVQDNPEEPLQPLFSKQADHINIRVKSYYNLYFLLSK